MGAVAGLIALAVHSAVDFNLRIPSNAALAAVLAAAVAAGLGGRPLPRPVSATFALATTVLLGAAVALPVEPWLRAREETRLAALATTPETRALRLERAETALRRLLRRRPAYAESWLMLAGVRSAAGDAVTGSSLAGHAVTLDPERAALREAASRLQQGNPPASRP
jgi:cytochrome c-type biogenesis protein CcmH/NrfG